MTSRDLDAPDPEAGAPDSENRTRTRLVLVGSALATIIAFRDVLVAPFDLIDLAHFDYWFFIPDRDSGALSVLIASWLVWNRRAALAACGTRSVRWPHWLLGLSVVFLFVWAVSMRIQVQLIPILCVTLATLAFAWGGGSAVRLFSMPCLALMLAFPPPAPLQAEIIWRLQGATAVGAHATLSLLGYATQLEGTELRMGDFVFIIIEACSGWRGIQILSLVGLAAAELWKLPLRRTIWVVFAALPLGMALNIIRACLVMLTQQELKTEIFESHTPQGLAVLMVGGVILYALATFMRSRDADSSGGSEMVVVPDDRPRGDTFIRWAALSLLLPIVLGAVSLVTPLALEPIPERPRYQFRFPTSRGEWTGTKLDPNYFFPYSTASNSQFHVDYRFVDDLDREGIVDFFIARELPSPRGLDRMPDSKLLRPSNDWTIESRNPVRILKLGIDGEEAIVTREAGTEKAYVIAWRLHDRGLAAETVRALFVPQDCERSADECLRAVVRIVVPIHFDDGRGRQRASKVAGRFIDDFILPLKILERI